VIFGVTLEQSGHQVTEARDGIEGLACILAEKPDVAIIDIGLPGMDGYEVARRVRAALGHSVMLVAMTGSGMESDRLEALSAGFNRHMTKPIDIELVLRIVDGCAASGGDRIALEGQLAGDLAALGGGDPVCVVQSAALSRGIPSEKSINLALQSSLRSGFPTGKA
jgi:CheY-like chemotaxis protein